jgi:hypothetical protein
MEQLWNDMIRSTSIAGGVDRRQIALNALARVGEECVIVSEKSGGTDVACKVTPRNRQRQLSSVAMTSYSDIQVDKTKTRED